MSNQFYEEFKQMLNAADESYSDINTLYREDLQQTSGYGLIDSIKADDDYDVLGLGFSEDNISSTKLSKSAIRDESQYSDEKANMPETAPGKDFVVKKTKIPVSSKKLRGNVPYWMLLKSLRSKQKKGSPSLTVAVKGRSKSKGQEDLVGKYPGLKKIIQG